MMSDRWLITGGARSGKSSYAERLAAEARVGAESKPGVLYVATAVAAGAEMEERIAKHRADRPKDWITWERYRGLADIETRFDPGSFDTILLDCVGNLLMGILFEEVRDPDDFRAEEFERVEQLSISEIDALCEFAAKRNKQLLLVTNEVGMGIVPEGRYSRYYRDALGRINKHAARVADHVVLMVSGLPLVLK